MRKLLCQETVKTVVVIVEGISCHSLYFASLQIPSAFMNDMVMGRREEQVIKDQTNNV